VNQDSGNLNIRDNHIDMSFKKDNVSEISSITSIQLELIEDKFFELVNSSDEKILLQYIFFAIKRANTIKENQEEILTDFLPRVIFIQLSEKN
jgi:hypothetical protein